MQTRIPGYVLLFLFTATAAFAQVTLSEPPTGKEPPLRVRISEGVAEHQLIHRIEPKYPKEALKKHMEGAVLLGAIIDQNGEPKNVHLISGHPIFAEAAMDAVKQWKYKPYLLNGQPADAETIIRVTFRL